MISAVAFVPQAPLLVPELTGVSGAELTELRSACRDAIRAVAQPDRQLVLIGAGARNTAHSRNARGTLAEYGAPLEVALGSDEPGPVELPPSLTVGAVLTVNALGPNNGAIGYSVNPHDPGFRFDAGQSDVALVVLGDGTACRTLKAPRYLDERAARYDESIAAALRAGDGAALVEAVADSVLAAQLSVAGAPVWQGVGAILDGEWDAQLRYNAAPFGVGYFVAIWTRR